MNEIPETLIWLAGGAVIGFLIYGFMCFLRACKEITEIRNLLSDIHSHLPFPDPDTAAQPRSSRPSAPRSSSQTPPPLN